MCAFLVAALSATRGYGEGEKIGLLVKERRSTYWIAAEKGAQEAAATAKVQLVVKGAPSVQQAAMQTPLLDALARENCAALVVSALAPKNLEPQLKALSAKGVKIVAADVPLPGIADVFVGQDQSGMAEAGARYLATLVGDNDEVAIFKNNTVDLGTMERERKAVEILKTLHPTLRVDQDVYMDTDGGTQDGQAKFLLEKHPGVKAIFVSSGAGTNAMIKALTDTKQAGKIKLVGFGLYLSKEAADAIEAGTVSGWIAQESKEVGRKGVETAVALVQNQKTPPNVYADFLLVTKDNLRDPKAQALLTEP